MGLRELSAEKNKIFVDNISLQDAKIIFDDGKILKYNLRDFIELIFTIQNSDDLLDNL